MEGRSWELVPVRAAPSPPFSPPDLSHQINDELNHQFEAVCESVFGEVESQAVEALDLPGCFRMRSHSYLRAIQAGCSQDDDCLSLFSMSAPPGPAITSSILKPSTCEYRPAAPGLCSWVLFAPLHGSEGRGCWFHCQDLEILHTHLLSHRGTLFPTSLPNSRLPKSHAITFLYDFWTF